ncbi:acetylornithine deacetylase [Acetobacteraceae bacterium H6797]|nr:acetylornithine deacetylase [Acetobacteraceae bacterium H6797]
MTDLAAATALLARLVSFDTTSARPNLALIDWARAWLEEQGIASRVLLDPASGKANLHAVIGPAVAGGIALSGHVDCVPVEGQAWSGDPFTLRQESGRLIGRGATDMKGFVACMLAMAPAFRDRGLARPIHLCLTFDEETTMAGAPLLVERLADGMPPPAMAIVGEPTGMGAVIGHKGYASWDGWVSGVTGHSSRPDRTLNALEMAAEAVVWLRGAARRLRESGPRHEGFEPPFSTVHVGTFNAGSVLNIVPDRADFTFEMRYIPGEDPEALLGELSAHLERLCAEPTPSGRHARFGFGRRSHAPALDLPEGHALAGLVKRLAGRNDAARVSYGTEAGFFARAGIPAIVCGPGDIREAHQPDEWIAESEIAACLAFLHRLADTLAQD